MKTVLNAVPESVCNSLADQFGSRIEKNEPVLFLCSGGATAEIAVEVCKTLVEWFKDYEDKIRWLFTVSLTDEHYESENHTDSNWARLVSLGLPLKNIGTVPVLHGTKKGDEALEETVHRYNSFLAGAAEKKEKGHLFIAALFGIGTDDYTAGILPGSPAVVPEAKGKHDQISFPYAAGYRSSFFTRLTIAPQFFPLIDLASVWINPKENPEGAARLAQDFPVAEHPAQLLKKAGETVVYVAG